MLLLKYLGAAAVGAVVLFGAAQFLALGRDQRAMLRELQEIKALLQGRPAPAAPGAAAQAAQKPPAAPNAVPENLTMTTDAGAVKGRADARLTIIEFSDFECPFCGRYMRETYGQIQSAYVDTGKIRYAFRHFPLERIHPRAMKAGAAAECARQQGKFWEMHDRLFANQQALDEPALIGNAAALGINAATFQSCINGAATMKIRQDLEVGSRAGVTGTPAFFIGTTEKDGSVRVRTKLVGAQPYSAFQSAIDALLKDTSAN